MGNRKNRNEEVMDEDGNNKKAQSSWDQEGIKLGSGPIR